MRACSSAVRGRPVTRGSLPDVRRRASATLAPPRVLDALASRGRAGRLLRPRHEGPSASRASSSATLAEGHEVQPARQPPSPPHRARPAPRSNATRDAALAALVTSSAQRPTLWRPAVGSSPPSWSPGSSRRRAACGSSGWDAGHPRWRGASPRAMLAAVTGDLRDGCHRPRPRRARARRPATAAPRRSPSSGGLVRLAGERGWRACPWGRTARSRDGRDRPRSTDALAIARPGRAPRAIGSRTRAFPADAIAALEQAGVLGAAGCRSSRAAHRRPRRRRAPTPAVARIVDGHLNAVERLARGHAEDPLRERELAAVAADGSALGVWGADPRARRGRARLHPRRRPRARGQDVLLRRRRAAAGDRARPRGDPPPSLAYVDLTRGALARPGWFAAPGMRASVSHRVVFDGAPVLAVLGAPGRDRAGAVVRARRGAHRGHLGRRGRRRRRRGGRACSRRGPSRPSSTRLPPAASAPSRHDRALARRGRAPRRRRHPAPREDGAYLRHAIATATSRPARRGGARAAARTRSRPAAAWTARAATSSSSRSSTASTPSSPAPAQPRWRRPR